MLQRQTNTRMYASCDGKLSGKLFAPNRLQHYDVSTEHQHLKNGVGTHQATTSATALPTLSPTMNSITSFDPRNIDIKTKSLEKTLLPLVMQISCMVNFKDNFIVGGKLKSEKAIRTAFKIGNAIQASVERFVAIGETIADENPDIQPEIYDACQAARRAGALMADLHRSSIVEGEKVEPVVTPHYVVKVDRTQLVKAARQLLSSVTRVLILADRVVVKHILRSEDKIAQTLIKLEQTSTFNEFVRIFTEFGGNMVDLAHKSGERQKDLKNEKRRAQMQVARNCLERYTMLLLTSSKTLLRHPDDLSARQCRDGVFNKIRLALQLIGICITDGLMEFEPEQYAIQCNSSLDEQIQGLDGPLDLGFKLTINIEISQLSNTLEIIRKTLVGSGFRERLLSSIDSLTEMSRDFTDSDFTPAPQREQMLKLLDQCQLHVQDLITLQSGTSEILRTESIEMTVENLNLRLKDFQKQLQMVALEQIAAVFRLNEDQQILKSIKTCSLAGDIDGVETFLGKFQEHACHLQEVCHLLHHISPTDALHITTGHAERNLRALSPLTLLAGRTLCLHPSSRIARENLEVFCDAWSFQINDLSKISKELDIACSERLAAEKQAYMSLPKPGRHGSTQKPTKPPVARVDLEEQETIAKIGLEMKMLTTEVEAEAEKWDEYGENDIVKRAKSMSAMAYNMYLFTKNDGPLKTTHDLFTQAEFFAEQANKMLKSVKAFLIEVPGSPEKNNLQQIIEVIPNYCQNLQVLVKQPSVGKQQTFEKVNHVISETKCLMNEIAKLVTICFICSTQFEIEAKVGPQKEGDYSQGPSRETSVWTRRRTPARTPASGGLAAGSSSKSLHMMFK